MGRKQRNLLYRGMGLCDSLRGAPRHCKILHLNVVTHVRRQASYVWLHAEKALVQAGIHSTSSMMIISDDLSPALLYKNSTVINYI
jgi:hypothetical protein